MNEADKKAFDEAFAEYRDCEKPNYDSYENGWIDALAHRDKQAGDPIELYPCGFQKLHSLVVEKAAYLARGVVEGEPITESMRRTVFDLAKNAVEMASFLVKQPLYTTPPAAQVNEQMLAALERLVEIENGPIMWEVAGWAEATMGAVDAIAAAKAAKGEL